VKIQVRALWYATLNGREMCEWGVPTEESQVTKDFYSELLKLDNLHRAWQHVRKSAIQSTKTEIAEAAKEFETKAHSEIRSIQGRLIAGTYKFPAAEGVLKDKKKRERAGKSPRPIVISTLEGRIVQRAILQVLQPEHDHPLYSKLGKLRDVNESRYGIGGIQSPVIAQGVGASAVMWGR